MLRRLASLLAHSECRVASCNPAAILGGVAVRPHSAAAVGQPCAQLNFESAAASAVRCESIIASGLADPAQRDDHAASAALPQLQQRRRPDNSCLPLHGSWAQTQHAWHPSKRQSSVADARRGYSNGRRSQHADRTAAYVQSSGGSGSIAPRSWWQQVRRWSAAVPGNGGSKRKGEAAESNYELSDVLSKLQQPPLHNSILSQQGRQAEDHEWKVLEFRPADGSERGQPSVQQVTATPESLGLAPRDISLFAADTGPGKQRATISVRGNEILFRSECCRAIIRADRAFLFPSRRQADTVKLAHALGTNIARGSNGGNMHGGNGIGHPFEFRVLECLLAATVSYFEGKAERLSMLTDSVLMDIMDAVDKAAKSGGLQPQRVDLKQLLPIQRSLTELTADVKETSDAIDAVANDDAALAAICLSERPSKAANLLPAPLKGDQDKQRAAMYRGAGLLESYQRQVQSLDGSLQELEENIDTVREVWHMSLDNTRNRTLQLNLAISVASFALMASTVPASFFGMNLHSGMEDNPHLLFYVAGGCLALSTAVFFGVIAGQRYWPNDDQKRKVRDLGATKELLAHHLSDLDDILAALRIRNDPVDKKGFAQLVGEAQRTSGAGHGLTDAEVELLFKAFDTNRDGKIDTGDAMRSRQDLARREIGRTLM